MPIKCKYCKYYEQPKMRGHGEYWGECKYISKLAEEIRYNRNQIKEEESYLIVIKDPFQYIRDEEDNCIFLKILLEKT